MKVPQHKWLSAKPEVALPVITKKVPNLLSSNLRFLAYLYIQISSGANFVIMNHCRMSNFVLYIKNGFSVNK